MILVLDFGSQYTQLIARRIREAKVYCEIHPFNLPLDKIAALRPEGIILSGGPASVYQENAPRVERELFQLPVPFLGICYGMGLINIAFGGEAGRADRREYGPADLTIDDDADLFHGFAKRGSTKVWMSHGDKMMTSPSGWHVLAHSGNSPIAAFADPTRRAILRLLRRGEMNAGELADRFGISKPSMSHHFTVLKQADLIASRREGQQIYYSLNTTVVEDLMAAVWDLFPGMKSEDRGPQNGKLKQ